MPWSDVVCHESVRQIARRSAARGMLTGTHIVYGPAGAGQEAVGRALAQTLLCPHREGDFCGVCSVCGRIEEGIFSDLILLRPDEDWSDPKKERKRKTYSIDHMRMVTKFAMELPYEAERKVFLMRDAHRIEVAAANSLLKLLEEPPRHAQFFLLTDSIGAILPTILSRCRKLRLTPLDVAQLARHLSKRVEPLAAETVARAAGGLPQRAEALLESGYLDERDQLLERLKQVRQHESALYSAVNWLAKDKDRFASRMEIVLSLLRDGLLCASGVERGLFRNPDRIEAIRAIWSGDRREDIVADLDASFQALEGLDRNWSLPLMLSQLWLRYRRTA